MYNQRLGEWKEYEKFINWDGITRKEYDKLLPAYKKYWKSTAELEQKLLIQQGDSEKAKEIDFKPPLPNSIIIEPYYELEEEVVTKPELRYMGYKIYEFIKLFYPKSAKAKRISGEVILNFICNKRGYPENLVIVSESPKGMHFGQIAKEALKSIRFTPANKNGVGVPVKTTLAIVFKPDYKLSEYEDLKNSYYNELNNWKMDQKNTEIHRSNLIKFKDDYIISREYDKIVKGSKENKNLEIFIDFQDYNLLPNEIYLMDSIQIKTMVEKYPPLLYVSGASGYAVLYGMVISDANGEKRLQVNVEDEFPKDMGIEEISLYPFRSENKTKLTDMISIEKSDTISFRQKIYFISSPSKMIKTRTVSGSNNKNSKFIR